MRDRMLVEPNMEIPIRFPHLADVIAKEADERQYLSVEQRLNKLLLLIASGRALLRNSPGEDGRRIAKERAESDWQRAHRKVFEQHG